MRTSAKPEMSRREFVATVGATSVAAQGVLGCARVADDREMAQTRMRRPNILLIISDQHRADCTGVYGNPDIRTPHLDALALDGVRYDRCYCTFPVCTPSRYSILSGLYVHEHRGWNNRCTLHPDIATFPKTMRAAGYRTMAIGKMHFTPTYLDVGFDRMVLSEQDGDGRWDDDYHRELMQHDLIDVNDIVDQRREYRELAPKEYWDTCGALASNLPLEFHSTEWAGRKALDEIEGWGPNGNLLVVSFIKPHHPFDPPEALRDLYKPETLSLPPGWIPECRAHDLDLHAGYFPHDRLTEAVLRRVTAYYYATIEHIDRQIGRMVETLKRKGLYESTIIVYTSDHGEYLGYHHLLLKGGYMYEPLARVPLIVKYAHSGRKGEAATELVNLVDLTSTLLGQAGCPAAREMRGHDLGHKHPHRDVVFAESGRGGQVMARTPTHKLLLSDSPRFGQLFDLERDPLELNNLYDDAGTKSLVAELTARIKEWQGDNASREAYLDLDAPVIDQPNVPPRDLSHRARIIEFTRKKFDSLRNA
jgi:arylsulfatase